MASTLRWVRLLDWLVLVLALTAVAINATGGFYVEVGGLRISARRTDRATIAALAALLVRMRIGGGISPLGGRLHWVRAWRDRWFTPASDPQPDLSNASPRLFAFSLALLGFIGVGAVLLRTQLAHMDSVPDLGDPLFSMWRMGWVSHKLAGDPRWLFDANIFYPEPLTFAYSDSMLIPALMGAPLLAGGFHPVVAYNVLLVFSFVLSAVTTHLLIVRVTGSARAGFVGGLMYGFYPYRFEHYSHLELQMTYWMPLGLIALHRFNDTRRVRYAVAFALAAVGQLYSSMYYGVFFPFYAGSVLWTLLLVSRMGRRQVVAPLAIAGGVALALALPLARPYIAAQPVKGDRDGSTVATYSANASDYLRSHSRSAVYGGRLLADEYPERALFPGVTPLVLSAVALAPPIGVIRLAYFSGLLTAFDLSRGFNGFSYRLLYDWFSPIRGMRVPARVSVIMAISLAMLGACGAKRLLDRCRTKRSRQLAFCLLVAAVATDLHPTLNLQRVWPEPPPIYGAAISGAVLAEFPFINNEFGVADGVQYMYFSLWHWLPLVNGYSGFTTESSQKFRGDMVNFPGPMALAALKRRGVTHVSVNCAFMGDGCEEFLEALDARPDFRPVASGSWQGSPVRLYRLLR